MTTPSRSSPWATWRTFELARRGLSKRTRQVIRLAVLRDCIEQEQKYPMPNAASIARTRRDHAVNGAIINAR